MLIMLKEFTNTDLRLIQAGSSDLVRGGQFIVIFPPNFPRKEEEQGLALARGEV